MITQSEQDREAPGKIHAGLLARNTALNLLGNVIPLAVGLITIPYVVRGLGSDGFGVLSIGWVLLGYFSLFDLGLGRATTKFVSEALGRGELNRLPALVWTSLGYQLAFGAGGSLIIGAWVPVLVDHILKVPPGLVHETKISFWLLAASLPIALTTTALRSVLESAQRFDLVNYVKVPANISVFLLPALALKVGLRLPGIILLLVMSRLAATVAYLMLCAKIFPGLRRSLTFDPGMFRPLVSYGGYVTVSSIVGPVLVYVDRFVIGSLLSMAAVGYYTAPSEIVGRLSIFPGSLVVTLFPAFSSLEAGGAKRLLADLYARSVKLLVLTLGPAMVLVVVFAQPILRYWLGEDFVIASTRVLQILALGVLLNSLALIPFTLIQGLGRPDVTAYIHLAELPFYGGLLWLLISRMGINGAALAWTLRMGIDATLLFGAACQLRLASVRALIENGVLRGLAAVLGLVIALLVMLRPGQSLFTQLALAALLMPVFSAGAWSFVLDGRDKRSLSSLLERAIPAWGRVW